MERNPVSSSAIKSIGYDPESHNLEVEFDSGSVYRYSDVDEDLYEQMLRAESVGSFFSERIRDKGYDFHRIR